MSPALHFILFLLLRMAIAAASVGTASIITDPSPLTIGALIPTRFATGATPSGWVGARISATIALYPRVSSSMLVSLYRRSSVSPTAGVLANSAWGLLGFGMAIAVMHVAVVWFGSAVGQWI